MREGLNDHPTNSKFEEETKLLEPLGIKAPLLPARIIGQNYLQTQIIPIELVAAEIRGNMAIAAFAESQERTGDVELELELPQLPQVLQNLAILSPLVMESAAQENLAPTGQKTVKIASSDRLTFAPITVPSNHHKTKPNLKPSTPTTATPEAWSNITDLLANVDSADIGNIDHVIGQPPIKPVITPQQRTETFTQQMTSPHRSAQQPDRRNLELLAQEVYAFIQQQLLIEREFHSQFSSGRLPW
ncbi:hypothetical protein [Calothrix sp. PCC 7507]|uniref:hypothetical protein n=1 Tax=Calothrix sp. PCC 7507 TaxID=99598 RepID=UPI00029F4BA3|nr:hypothetical protein [Calothrix sp. PCC 7507]AFY32734.1 hypothetical protein Cal7507_2299 [Calothrix sp. PCC 7507]